MSESISLERKGRGTGGLPVSRRRFLAGAAGAVAVPLFVPASVLGRNSRTAANDPVAGV